MIGIRDTESVEVSESGTGNDLFFCNYGNKERKRFRWELVFLHYFLTGFPEKVGGCPEDCGSGQWRDCN